jgi:hypothetical protein
MEEDIMVIALKSLFCAYEHFIKTLNINNTNVDLKFEALYNKLLQWDKWKKQCSGSSEAEGTK